MQEHCLGDPEGRLGVHVEGHAQLQSGRGLTGQGESLSQKQNLSYVTVNLENGIKT